MEKESVTLENRSHLLIKSQERMTYLKFLKPYYFRIQSLFLFFNFLCLSSCCSNTLSASLLTIPREDINGLEDDFPIFMLNYTQHQSCLYLLLSMELIFEILFNNVALNEFKSLVVSFAISLSSIGHDVYRFVNGAQALQNRHTSGELFYNLSCTHINSEEGKN